MNIQTPARHLRENPSHSFNWRMLCTAQSFHKRRIIEGLSSNNGASVSKQFHSYVRSETSHWGTPKAYKKWMQLIFFT